MRVKEREGRDASSHVLSRRNCFVPVDSLTNQMPVSANQIRQLRNTMLAFKARNWQRGWRWRHDGQGSGGGGRESADKSQKGRLLHT